ncbi:MAG: hypothetical protein M1830_008910 [Pleopsidium flavum]|nr:MAG: hypothetical protein M1830_008910 [Pleopsidium flavum]
MCVFGGVLFLPLATEKCLTPLYSLHPDPMQLVDELSMIYTTCLMCYATFSYSKSRQFALLLALSLISLAIFITLYYHYLQDPAFHQNAYALLTAVVLFRSMYVMEFSLRPSLRQMEEEHRSQQGKNPSTAAEKETQKIEDRRDEKILGTMWLMIGCGLSIFIGGFGIWSLDNEYCSDLRRWRRELGLPWGILLEGHGWWYVYPPDAPLWTQHIMTGIGAYFYITWGVWLRHCLNGRQNEYTLNWPRLLSLPEIVRSGDSNGIPVLNGIVKKLR